MFSDVFRVYRRGVLGTNGLIINKLSKKTRKTELE